MQSERVYKRPIYIRSLFVVVAIACLCGAGYLQIDQSSEVGENSERLDLYVYAALLLALFMLISAFRHRVLVTDDYVEVREFRTRRMQFADVVGVEIQPDNLVLQSSDMSIRIDSQVRRHGVLFADIKDRVAIVADGLSGWDEIELLAVQNAEGASILQEETDLWSAKGFAEMHKLGPNFYKLYVVVVGENAYSVQVLVAFFGDESVTIQLHLNGSILTTGKFLLQQITYHADGRVDVKF